MSALRSGVFRGSEWRQRFAARLLKLVPNINPDAADELSDTQFAALAAMAPERAALDYATSHRLYSEELPSAQLRG